MKDPGFDLEDVVRGGRRRRRRRTALQVAAAVVAVAALSSGIALPQLGGNGNGTMPAASPTASPTASAAPKPAGPAIVLAEEGSLTYKKTGETVTVTRKGEPVTTITLQSASYTATSGHVVFQFTAVRALTVDTAFFVLYDSAGENSANNETKLHLAPGTHTVTLDFSGTGKPQAVGWAAADGDATWPRNG